MILELLCFHGSPGLPEDFELLSKALSAEVRVIAPARPGYPGATETPAHSGSAKRFVVGYSWGAREALDYAARNSGEIAGVILIAPFLKLAEKPGALKKGLISLPVIGDLILSKAAPGAIGEFLRKSSSPVEVPAFYRAQQDKLAVPAVVRQSILEKDAPELDLAAIADRLHGKPVLLIHGEKDETSSFSEHVEPLMLALKPQDRMIVGGGHALVYTHFKLLAEEISKFLRSSPIL